MCHVARRGGLLITLRGVPRRAGSEPARLSESGYAALVVVDPRLKTDAVALRPRPAGLPEREALKLEELWHRDEVGMELSVEVRAPVIVGVYPMRIARYAMDHNGHPLNGNGYHPPHEPILTEAVDPSILASE